MEKRTLYTAVGHLKKKREGPSQVYPVILINHQEYLMDIQEMTVWTALCWRLLDYKQLEEKYEQLAKGLSGCKYTLESCVGRLQTRGLIAVGTGETDFDALYDLLGTLYVVPISEKLSLRIAAYLKLVLLKGVSHEQASILFRRDHSNEQEANVMALSKQVLLSTAELIKCFDVGAQDISSGQKLMNALYNDADTTSDTIAYLVQDSLNKAPVTAAVANLYLRKQVIFERL